uniref:Peroxisomal ATPase PEX6 n=1 Tax=Phallusia mammillata TaxID=59560 RepID=A0A6F9DNM8_9ASCI|nr:peroxisome assembly factor 2-like [Phallusia mammillata]
MDFHDCQIETLKTWKSSSHPLHLIVDKVKWLTLSGRFNSPVIIVLKKRTEVLSYPAKSSWMCLVQLEHYPNKRACKDESIAFYCSEEFVRHYGISSPICDKSSFAFVSAFPLERILLVATTSETFQWAKEQSFETGLLVSSACNHSLFARQNDMFLSSIHQMYGQDRNDVLQRFRELTTVECLPLQQGLITTNTAVTVVNLQDLPVRDVPLTNENKLVARFCDYIDVSETEEKKLVINKMTQTISSVVCSESFATYFDLLGEEQVELQVLQGDTVVKSRVCQLKVISDEHFCIHMTHKSSPLILDGVTPCQNCLFTLQLPLALWYNIHHPKVPPVKDDFIFKVCKVKLNLPYAREIHVSLVLSPHYSPSSHFDKTLVIFLTTTRILRVGDVIPIDVSDDIDFYEAADAKSCSSKVVYYKVMKLDEDASPEACFQVDLKHTSLYQDGTTNSLVPSLVSNQDGQHLSTGLDKFNEMLKSIMLPYFTSMSFSHSCAVLVSGQPGCGKTSIINTVCNSLCLHVIEVDCLTLVGDTAGSTEAKINEAFRRASVYTPCAIVLEGIDCLGKNRETDQAENRVCIALAEAIQDVAPLNNEQASVFVIATTTEKANVVTEIRTLFLHEVEIEAPGEFERQLMARFVSRNLSLARNVQFDWIAKHTAGFVYSDIWELFRKAVHISHKTIIEKCAVGTKLSWRDEQCVCMAGVVTSHQQVVEALDQMQADRADSIGVPKIPDVKWDDIGGLEEVKNHILDTIQLPLDHPELVSVGLKRSGVLLYGPPGTGKTLLAKAVASQCALSFLSVKGPELINMYIGQSEENVRRVFQRARDAAPCVIFFDELDALAPNRGRSGDSGGVMDRVVSQLLAELDGVNGAEDRDKQVFVIAASNRPDLIDSALLRPGRLDKLLYVGISESRNDQLKVLRAQTKKLNLSPTISLEEVVQRCPLNITGADFYALACDAAMNAIRRHIQLAESRGSLDDQSECVVMQDDLLRAAESIVPSVNAEQLENYKRVKADMAR